MQDLQPLKALLDEMGCAYLEEEPMCDHTTFKIGGPADLFVKPASLQAACRVVEACREMEIPLLPVGGGSNLLVSDMGIRRGEAVQNLFLRAGKVLIRAGVCLGDSRYLRRGFDDERGGLWRGNEPYRGGSHPYR